MKCPTPHTQTVKEDFFLSTNFVSDSKNRESIIIDNYDFSGKNLHNLDFFGFTFINCKFDNCGYLHEIIFRACVLENCTFINSHLHDFKFLECEINNSIFQNSILTYFIFGDTIFSNTSFKNCPEILELYFGGCEFKNLSFNEVYFAHSRFEGHERDNYKFKMSFKNSVLDHNFFLNFNLKNSTFRNCSLGKTTFSNCFLNKNTIDKSNSAQGTEFSFIDFQSIIKSEPIEPIILEKCFGINESVIKEKISGIINKIEYQTIFISYSFKDKDFAIGINNSLKKKGISTFLWEKDAPGGKGLKKIMKENIKKQDRLLFIASENSIKSKACHFELLQGRIKQEESWQEILFPIHIDNFLFNVEKDDIKPLEVQNEYWQNIKELREINSIDFCAVKDKIGEIEFENKIIELINGLKK